MLRKHPDVFMPWFTVDVISVCWKARSLQRRHLFPIRSQLRFDLQRDG